MLHAPTCVRPLRHARLATMLLSLLEVSLPHRYLAITSSLSIPVFRHDNALHALCSNVMTSVSRGVPVPGPVQGTGTRKIVSMPASHFAQGMFSRLQQRKTMNFFN